MSDCIFCKLANKEIPTEFLYEDENVVAFNDLNPLMPVHVLVVPKNHYNNIIDGIPASTLESVTNAIAAVTEKMGIKETGFRVITNTGKHGGQSVNHVHFHILGGKQMDDSMGCK